MGLGSFFKKITKPFRKITKAIGKGIKKIGKGIMKVFAKVAKPFAKFGIVGQIALAMFMPWAIGGIMGGLASSAFGTFAQGLTQSTNLFSQAAGYVMKGVHYGATQINAAYSTITKKISDGFEFLGNKTKEVFGGATTEDSIAKAITNPKTPDFSTAEGLKIAEEAVVDPFLTDGLTKETSTLLAKAEEASRIGTSSTVKLNIPEIKLDGSSLSKQTGIKIGTPSIPEVAEKTFYEKTKEKAIEAVAEAPAKIITSAVSGAGEVVEDYITGGDEDMLGGSASYAVPDFIGDNASYTTYNATDLTLQNAGYNYGGPIYQAQVTSHGFGKDAYFNYFNNLSNYK